MNLAALEIYNEPDNYKKVRLGKDNDGGYVVCMKKEVEGLKSVKETEETEETKEYDCFIACGVSDDVSFEKSFLEQYPYLKCYAFDGTIKNGPDTENSNIEYVYKNISSTNSDLETNLHDIIDKHNNVFIKMDIEGHEFPWLSSLSEEHLKKIKQFVVEFHYPLLNTQSFKQLEKMLKTHKLVHLHPHNACGYIKIETDTLKNFIMPNLIECTYMRIDEENSDEKFSRNMLPIPTKIDQKNIVKEDELILCGYPFCGYNLFKN